MGAVLVAKSNKSMLAEQEWLEKKGIIAIPGTSLRSEIESIRTYLAGGLFFSLSIGLCYAFTWGFLIWALNHWKGIRILIAILSLSFLAFLFLSRPGWNKYLTFGFFLFAVPILLLFLDYLMAPVKMRQIGFIKGMPYIVGLIGSIIIVYRLFAPSLNSRDFIQIRDSLFGRINLGRKISNFYYHYTLYPARAIKNFNQKLQKTIKIDTSGFTEKQIRLLQSRLLWKDIFLGKDSPSNTIIKKTSGHDNFSLICESPRFVIDTNFKEFNDNPDSVLDEYNIMSDSTVFLRQTISISLFCIWPVMGISFIYCFFLFLWPVIFKDISPVRDTFMAFFLILVIMAGFHFLLKPERKSLSVDDLLTKIEGNENNDKIMAIMSLMDIIEDEKIDTRQFSTHFIKMLDNPDPIIRKWGIIFLTKAKEKKGIKHLIGLLNDPDSSVSYHAARSLGKLKAIEAKDPLLSIIKGEGEWYLKSTAYLALREIGWRQNGFMYGY